MVFDLRHYEAQVYAMRKTKRGELYTDINHLVMVGTKWYELPSEHYIRRINNPYKAVIEWLFRYKTK